MLNYFNYFTEIEQRFQQRRGTLTLLSTLDWALIESWREAGVPLEAVLRGIDTAFDKHDARRSTGRRPGRVNGLAWAAQAVMTAAMEMQEAAVGIYTGTAAVSDSGFEVEPVVGYLRANAEKLETAATIAGTAGTILQEIASRLRAIVQELPDQVASPRSNEALERTLSVLEEKLFAVLPLMVDEAAAVAFREQATRELAPYRSRMAAAQLKQVTEQFLHKRMLERTGLPRLSLFYMEHR